MTYRAGIAWGEIQTRPRIQCDDCGVVRGVSDRSVPPKWFLNGKPPPGWWGCRVERDDGSIVRLDYCQTCRGADPGGAP